MTNRICKLCDSRAIEDEFHFLMQCSRYTEFREVLCNKSSNLMLVDNLFATVIMKNSYYFVNIHIDMYLSLSEILIVLITKVSKHFIIDYD